MVLGSKRVDSNQPESGVYHTQLQFELIGLIRINPGYKLHRGCGSDLIYRGIRYVVLIAFSNPNVWQDLDFAQVYGLGIMIRNNFKFRIDPIKMTLCKHNVHIHETHEFTPSTSCKNVHQTIHYALWQVLWVCTAVNCNNYVKYNTNAKCNNFLT